MEIINDGKNRQLTFYKGDEAIAGITDYCVKAGIKAAKFTIIGAVKELTLSYLDVDTKQYEDHDITENLEVAAVAGNFGFKDTGEPIIHAHGLFSDGNLQVKGGHIKKMVTSVTLEVDLVVYEGEIVRSHDEVSGVFLIKKATA